MLSSNIKKEILLRKICISLALLLSFTIAAQQKVRIYGYVIDANNRGIEYVNVLVEGLNVGTSTNQNGYYDISFEFRDSVSLQYSMVGYKTVRHVLKPTQRVVHATVELLSEAHEIRDIEIVAQRRQTNTIDYIDPTKYRFTPNAAGGIESLLITFSGVSQNNELSSQYNVRGGSYDENIVYVNGIEVYRPLLVRAGQQEGLSFINPDMVGKLAFSAGGFDAKYGDKMSSVLDIEYKRPAKKELSASLSLLGATAYLGTSNEKFSQMHGLRYKSAAYLLGALETKGEYNPAFFDYQTQLTYKLSDTWDVNFLGNVSQNTYRFRPTIRETNFGTYQMGRTLLVYFDGWEKDIFQTAFGALSFSNKPNKNTKLNYTASAFHTNEYVTYDISGEYRLSELKLDAKDEDKEGAVLGIGRYHEHARNRLKASVVNVAHTGEWRMNNHRMEWGANVQYEKITDKISEWEWRDSVGYTLPYSDTEVNMYYNLRANTGLQSLRMSGFVQDSYRWSSNAGILTITGGLRANYWNYNKELIASPRLSMAFLPFWEKDFGFRFATGLYYQTPFYKEMRIEKTDDNGNVDVELNKDIRAQRSLQFVLAGDHYFRMWGRPFKFSTETYLKLADRVISYNVDNVQVRYAGINDAKAYTAGIDFKLFGEMVPGTDSWINLSFMRSKEDIEGDFYTKRTYDEDRNLISSEVVEHGWVPRANEQRFAFSMLFQDYFPNNPKYKVQLKVVYADGLPYGPPRNVEYRNLLRAPAYGRVDIGASRVFVADIDKWLSTAKYNFIKQLAISLEVYNLLDFNNVNSYFWVTDIYNNQYPAPNYLTGRQFNLKFQIDFK